MSHDSPVLQTLPSALHISFPLCSVTLYPRPFIRLTPALPPALSQTQRAPLEALCPSVVEAVEVGALLKSLCWSESQWPSTRFGGGGGNGRSREEPTRLKQPFGLESDGDRKEEWLLPSRQVGESGVGTKVWYRPIL